MLSVLRPLVHLGLRIPWFRIPLYVIPLIVLRSGDWLSHLAEMFSGLLLVGLACVLFTSLTVPESQSDSLSIRRAVWLRAAYSGIAK